MTEVVTYSEIDRPSEHTNAGNGLIDKLLAVFDQRSQQMQANSEDYFRQELLHKKDLQADVLTGEMQKTENTTKKSGSGTFISKIIKNVTSVIPLVKAANVVSNLINTNNDTNESEKRRFFIRKN